MRSIKIGRLCTGLPGQKSKTMFQKYAVKKSAGYMAEMTEHLLNKCKSLN
jgi:hypothetical protein